MFVVDVISNTSNVPIMLNYIIVLVLTKRCLRAIAALIESFRNFSTYIPSRIDKF